MVGFFLFLFIFKYMDPQDTYMLLDLIPPPDHSRIIFRLSGLARVLLSFYLFPVDCPSTLNSKQAFSLLTYRRMWRSYTYTEKMRFITISTGNQLGYCAKILIANMYITVHHIKSLEISEEVYKYDC